MWRPVIDGVEQTATPLELAAAGKFSNVVPMLIGSNVNEGTAFNTLPRSASAALVQQVMSAQFGAQATEIVLQHYPFADYPTPWDVFSAVIGDSSFTWYGVALRFAFAFRHHLVGSRGSVLLSSRLCRCAGVTIESDFV